MLKVPHRRINLQLLLGCPVLRRLYCASSLAASSLYLSYFTNSMLSGSCGSNGPRRPLQHEVHSFGYNPAIGQFITGASMMRTREITGGEVSVYQPFSLRRNETDADFVKMQHLNDDLIGRNYLFFGGHYPLTKRFLRWVILLGLYD